MSFIGTVVSIIAVALLVGVAAGFVTASISISSTPRDKDR